MREQPRRRIFDHLARIWLVLAIGPGSILGLTVINPSVFRDQPTWRHFNQWFLYYGLFMLVSNWLLVRFTDTSVRRPVERDVSNCQWCNLCTGFSPPRSHHCRLCGFCVVKHDHHCFFTATCIGLTNQRYFVVFTFWLSLGTIYSFCVSVAYMSSPEWSSLCFLDCLLLPLTMCRLLLGHLSAFECFFVFLLHSMAAGMFVSSFLFVSQIVLIVNGLTAYERKKGMPSPWRYFSTRNLLSMSLGPWWPAIFFIPIGPFL